MRIHKYINDRLLNPARMLALPIRAAFTRIEQEPFFLTLVTVYNLNHPKAESTLDCMVRQLNKNVHYVFIDDCSPGEHFEFISRKLQHQVNWSYIKNTQNQGVGQALNNGLDFALNNVPNWTYFGRVDLEDDFSNDYFEILCNAVKVFHQHNAVSTLFSRIQGPNRRDDFCSGIAMYKRSTLSKIGGFDKTRFGVDLEYHMRYSFLGGTFAVVPAVKYFATFSNTGLTSLYPENGPERIEYFSKVRTSLKEGGSAKRKLMPSDYLVQKK